MSEVKTYEATLKYFGGTALMYHDYSTTAEGLRDNKCTPRMRNLIIGAVPVILDAINDDVRTDLLHCRVERLLDSVSELIRISSTIDATVEANRGQYKEAMHLLYELVLDSRVTLYLTSIIEDFEDAKEGVTSLVYDSRWSNKRAICELVDPLESFWAKYNKLDNGKPPSIVKSPVRVCKFELPDALPETVELTRDMCKASYDLAIATAKSYDQLIASLQPYVIDINRTVEKYSTMINELEEEPITDDMEEDGDSYSCGTK